MGISKKIREGCVDTHAWLSHAVSVALRTSRLSDADCCVLFANSSTQKSQDVLVAWLRALERQEDWGWLARSRGEGGEALVLLEPYQTVRAHIMTLFARRLRSCYGVTIKSINQPMKSWKKDVGTGDAWFCRQAIQVFEAGSMGSGSGSGSGSPGGSGSGSPRSSSYSI